MDIGLLADNRRWGDPAEPYKAIQEGLRKLGHAVRPLGYPTEKTYGEMTSPWSPEPDAIFVWGTHGISGVLPLVFRDKGKPAFVMERGFFDRFNYTQIDHAGFNATASWAPTLRTPAPAVGTKRFRAVWGRPPDLFFTRQGYCLVLLQISADAQLKGAEFQQPGPFVRAVDAAAPNGLEIRVRAHPLSEWHCSPRGRALEMIEGTLAEAVAGAKFAVTINSNAGNECLAMGCPVLCMGPAPYEIAGVAPRTTSKDLRFHLAEMNAGRRPVDVAVGNYLAHLACRQWARDELATGEALRMILDAAG